MLIRRPTYFLFMMAGFALCLFGKRAAAEPVCKKLKGDVTIATAKDWQQLVQRGCVEIAGNLTITASELTSLDGTAQVEAIGGCLSISETSTVASLVFPVLGQLGCLDLADNNALKRLSLPTLTTVGDVGAGPAVTSLNLPALAKAGDFYLVNNQALTDLDLPALVAVREFQASNAGALKRVNLAALKRSGRFSIDNNAELATVTLPALAAAEKLNFAYNPALKTLTLPALAKSETLMVFKNAALTKLDLPALAATESLEIKGNAALNRLHLPALKTLALSLIIADNPALSQCQVGALTKQLAPGGWSKLANLTGNQPAAGCP